MKILAISTLNSYAPQIKKENKLKPVNQNSTNPLELKSKFNDHLISFEARVDKGMNRFFNKNKELMPERVRALVEPMPNREAITPLQAQYYAYQGLEDAETVEDIKLIFSDPDEPLFADLKEVSQTNPTRGIIHSVKEMSEIYPDGVLKTKENLTVYLVKKIFLESKTVEEINQDLDEDLDKDFKEYYKGKNPKSPYIRSSTLSALGIKMPNLEYLTSLKYTRDGYSDMVGAKISIKSNEFLSTLTKEQRTARATRQTREFEKWWSQLTRKDKLELIAALEAEVEMLKSFKHEERIEKKRLKEAGIPIEENSEAENKKLRTIHTKVGSIELSRDELFTKWASLTLTKFKESLSQADLDTLHLKMMVNQVNRWKEMTPAERTDYISKMKAGAEPVRFTMIDAWNNSPEIIKALYLHLKENQVYKPADLLYSTEEFSQHQSKVMSEFWDNNPDFAQAFGHRIKESHNKVERAINNGTFEALKQEINRNKNQRKRELEMYKNSLVPPEISKPVAQEFDYKDDFRLAYAQSILGSISSAPENYFSDVYEQGLETLPEDIVRLWTRNLRNDKTLTFDEKLLLMDALKDDQNPNKVRYNRAFEFSLAEAIYALTKNPDIYMMLAADVKNVMYRLERGEKSVKILSPRDGQLHEFNVVKNCKINKNRINQVYESFKKDLSEEELRNILRYNFRFIRPVGNQIFQMEDLDNKLKDYINSYGRSANILFSDKSAYPQEVRAAFARKFFALMPEELKRNVHSHIEDDMDLSLDARIRQAQYAFGRRFKFLPQEIVDAYFKETGLHIKFHDYNFDDIDGSLDKICKKRTNATEGSMIMDLPKAAINDKYIAYQMLAIEQTLADSLFEVTGDENVYKSTFERLSDSLEVISLVEKFPVDKKVNLQIVDNSFLKLDVKKQVNFANIQKKYREYMKEIDEWLAETNNPNNPDYQELLYILNPEDDKPAIDSAVIERMKTYFPNSNL